MAQDPAAQDPTAQDPAEQALREAVRPSVRIIEKLEKGASRQVRDMLEAIAENFCTPQYSIARLKKDAGVDYRHVIQFRAATGLSPSQLIRECRMETGMRLLRDTLLVIEEIAILIGYDSERSLERLCQRWCGLPPSELRIYLRRARPKLQDLPEDVFSWYFWEQYRCNGLSDEQLQPVIEYLEQEVDPEPARPRP